MAVDTIPTLTPAQLHQATDVDLDHALARLYGLHARADDPARPKLHARIMAVLEEQAQRRDAWLAQHG